MHIDHTAAYDVVVVGGGPAGINAAIAAGRTGASTLLIEKYGFVGGMSTLALVYPWMTFHTMHGEQVIKGIAEEIVQRLVQIGASPGHVRDTIGFTHTLTPYDPEHYKSIAVQLLQDAKVDLLFHTSMIDADTADAVVSSVLVHNKSGFTRVQSKVFIDTTGDGDLVYRAGAPCEKGRGSDQLTQPMTMKFRMRGVDKEEIRQYMMSHPEQFFKKSLISELDRLPLTGVYGFYSIWKEANLPIPRDSLLFFFGPGEDEVLVNTTRVHGDGTNAADLTRGEIESRNQVLMLAKFMVEKVPGFQHARISQVGTQIGIRETRRVTGDYVLQVEDALEGRRFPDVIARSGYPVDIHDPKGKGVQSAWVKDGGAYDIPYRCLLPQKLSNVLIAGRCMSTSHEALSTTRLTPSCMATGQAAGTAAAMASAHRGDVRAIPIQELQGRLRRGGMVL